MCKLLLLPALAATAGAARLDTSVEAGLRGCTRMNSQVGTVPDDEVELIFVRHGVSLNNLFKKCKMVNAAQSARVVMPGADPHFDPKHQCKFQSGYEQVCNVDKLCGPYADEAESDLRWEIKHYSRDCLLHPESETMSLFLGSILESVLPKKAPIQGFYASPLRRTVQTLIGVGSKLFKRCVDVPVGVSPWAHERFKTDSDYAQDAQLTAMMADRYTEHLGGQLDEWAKTAVNVLKNSLSRLGDWAGKRGLIDPPTWPKAEENRLDVETYPFYPNGAKKESDKNFEARMAILRRWLQKLPRGGRHLLVSHGGIGKGLFKRWIPQGKTGLANLAVVVARYKPDEADPEDADNFFTDVQLAADKWDCEFIDGWRED